MPGRLLAALALLAPRPATVFAEQSQAAEDELSLLQRRLAVSHQGQAPAAPAPAPAPAHYWPRARGHLSHYSYTPYNRMPADLNKSLAWRWDAPVFNTMLWGALIDSQKNVYICGIAGIWKFSPTGQQLWYVNMRTEMPSLSGDTLVGMRARDVTAFALSLKTGDMLWSRKIWPDNGAHGDFVEVHDGVAVVAMGAPKGYGYGSAAAFAGSPSTHVAGVSVQDGSMLWSFKVDCGVWNIMAVFPDNESTVFSDMCGGAYRVGLHNGTLLWKSPGSDTSFTDGGSIAGPDGSIYTCSNPGTSKGQVEQPGVLRKRRLGDGAVLWEAPLPLPCVNFPAVTADGRSVVVAPGALSILAKSREAEFMPPPLRDDFFALQRRLVANGLQRSYYSLPNLDASIMSFDASTGALQWRHDVKPYGGVAFAGDEERATNAIREGLGLKHCWPAHWSAPTVDREGSVYIGRSSGDFYVYNRQRDHETTFHTGDGILMAGAAFAPGLMVFTTYSSVYAFHVPLA